MFKYLEELVYSDITWINQLTIPKDSRVNLKRNYGIDITHCLPGTLLEDKLQKCNLENRDNIHAKVIQSCRKLCMMWYAGERAVEAEQEFYSSTLQSSPALFGEDAIKINYYLESLLLIARSSLDVAANIFGVLLPDPFNRGRYDSFNKLVKQLTKKENRLEISDYFDELRNDSCSWLSIVSGSERGRSLRDKVSHQIEFPIEYVELHANSEKETAIVYIDGNNYQTIDDFVRNLVLGVIGGFMVLELFCCENLKS